jgi:hypothetical protein
MRSGCATDAVGFLVGFGPPMGQVPALGVPTVMIYGEKSAS